MDEQNLKKFRTELGAGFGKPHCRIDVEGGCGSQAPSEFLSRKTCSKGKAPNGKRVENGIELYRSWPESSRLIQHFNISTRNNTKVLSPRGSALVQQACASCS